MVMFSYRSLSKFLINTFLLTIFLDLSAHANLFDSFREAAKAGHIARVKYLLDSYNFRCFVDSKDETFGATILSHAAEIGNLAIVKIVLQYNPAINLKDTEWGKTALHYAAQGKHSNVVSLLLQKEAQVDIVDKEDMMPLHIASRIGDADSVRALLVHHAPINTTATTDQFTPLMIACCNGHYEAAKVLIEHGADTEITNITGKTAADIALDWEHGDIAALMLFDSLRDSIFPQL